MSEYTDDWKKAPRPIEKKIIMCGTVDCKAGEHKFKTNMRKKAARIENMTYRSASCVCCNEELVDWERIDKRDLDDTAYLFSRLKLEAWRKHYWKIPVKEKDLDDAKKKGLILLKKDIKTRIEKSLGPPSNKIFRDGTQTPKFGNIIFYAQHATATCCRKCAEEWYGIDRKKPLKKTDIKYLGELILLYVKKRFPMIKEVGI